MSPLNTPEQARSWRDLSDQLTQRQIERLGDLECRSPAGVGDAYGGQDMLLESARDMAAQNITEAVVFGSMPKPAGATRVYPCGDDPDGLGWCRDFQGTIREAGGVTVYTEGTQFADGTVSRNVFIDLPFENGALTVERARELAAAIIAAADEIDVLS